MNLFSPFNRKETPNDGKLTVFILYFMAVLGVLTIIVVVWKYFLSGVPLDTRAAEIIFKSVMYVVAAVFALVVIKWVLKTTGLDD